MNTDGVRTHVMVDGVMVWVGHLSSIPRVGERINHEDDKPLATVSSVEWNMTLGPVVVTIHAR